jgi:hypothetical protein
MAQEPNVRDAMLTIGWTTASWTAAGHQLDPYGLPDVNQMYVVPDSFALAHASMHNKAIFSLWAHFSEFCSLNCMTGNTGNKLVLFYLKYVFMYVCM